MAINHFLTIRNRNRALDPDLVRKAITSESRSTIDPISKFILIDGATISIGYDDQGQPEGTGITLPGICVMFQIKKFNEYESGITRMLQVTERVLREFEGEATLSLDYEETVLSRVDGQLKNLDVPGFWTPARQAIFANMR
ncbi:SitI3 family protein [Sorangium sp. So ce131]|uniref:SitI3 family protein n=1 Tax=Sorangium sp. So ce131 TaxID=3133282 RepID=UPI003F5D6936